MREHSVLPALLFVVAAARAGLAQEVAPLDPEFAAGQGLPVGDFDGDEDIDLHDFNALQICLSFSGPDVPTPTPCLVFDFDGDFDVDLADAKDFWMVFTGSLAGVLVEAGNLFPTPANEDGYSSGHPGTAGNNALHGIARQTGYSQDDLWYEWSLASYPKGSGEVIFGNPALPATAYFVFPPLVQGTYLFHLTVTNLSTGEFGEDTAALKVVECITDAHCDDGDACTEDLCANSVCDYAPAVCEDEFACTLDDCDAEAGCTHTGNDSLCSEDGLFCNGPEVCDPAEGCTGSGNPCAEGEICFELPDLCNLANYVTFYGPGFATIDVNDVDEELVRFDSASNGIVWAADATAYQPGSWAVTGGVFLGAGGSFQVRFGTRNGVAKAYFTETGSATICDILVQGANLFIFPTNVPVPQD